MGVSRLIFFQENKFTPTSTYFEDNSIQNVLECTFYHLYRFILQQKKKRQFFLGSPLGTQPVSHHSGPRDFMWHNALREWPIYRYRRAINSTHVKLSMFDYKVTKICFHSSSISQDMFNFIDKVGDILH